MALNQSQILFKKFIGGVTSTSNSSPYFNEIAGASNANVTLNRIWMLSQRIPVNNPLVAGVNGDTYGAGIISENINILEKVTVRLYRIQGTGGQTAAYAETVSNTPGDSPKSLSKRRFKNIINPFIYGAGYNFEVKNTSGDVINIFTPENDGYVDFDSGVLSLYGTSIYNADYVDITAYSYIGPLADETGLNMYAKLSSGVGGTGGGSAVTKANGKVTNVESLPAAGQAYNGLFYLVNNGNGGVTGDPIEFNVTFDYGSVWYQWVLDSNFDQSQFISISTPTSDNNNKIFTYDNTSITLEQTDPSRNQLLYVQSNEVILKDIANNNVFNYNFIEDLYYQFTDLNIWEPKSFEKTTNIELEYTATENTISDGHPVGFTLSNRSSNQLNFIELTQMYNLETSAAPKLNRNNFKMYVNGQKIDIFDDLEETPTFNGYNPLVDYNSFLGAFGDYSALFPISEGSETDPLASNTITVDLTAGDTSINDWFGVNSAAKVISEYRLKFDALDNSFIDYNRQYYDEQFIPSAGGDVYPFFFMELSDGTNTFYKRITNYEETTSGNSYEFTYDGDNLNGTGLTTMRLIYFKRTSKITGGESFFWLPSSASYQIEPGDFFEISYLGDIEKSILVKNNLDNLTSI